MFKRKTNLPARPPIPTRDEILTDLTNAEPNDIVFISKNKKEVLPADVEYITNANQEEDVSASDQYGSQKSGQAYMKVLSFIEKINHIEKHLIALEDYKKHLKLLEENLTEDVLRMEKEFQNSNYV
ncbi:hypothetical protein X975_21083, partial [Stegodyphus mimosarum]